jgi:uncharacterized membrane protein
MDINEQFRRNVRGFYAMVGATLLLGIGPAVAHRLVERESTASRVVAVVVGVASMLPWMWVVARSIRLGDEFVRRMHLVAIAIAAAASLILFVTVDWLQQAWFIKSADLTLMWAACLVLWCIAVIGTKRYYERER